MERFARVCPWHHGVLVERRNGRLRCPQSRHLVAAWLVVDLETGDVLGAGRGPRRGGTGVIDSIFLGPRLQLAPDVVLDRGDRRYALALPARPAAA